MGIRLSKNLKQNQSIRLTPSLKKSIDLLQLSRFELIRKINNEIIENPFLENKKNDHDLVDFGEFNFDIESKLTLRQTLLKQLDDFHLNNREMKISKLIIDSIDESGELVESIEQIEEISNFDFTQIEIKENLENIIHKLSPSGVGYRNHKECIKIQIDNNMNISINNRELINMILLNDELDNLSQIKKLVLQNGFSDNDFRSALEIIKNCDLSPGLNYEKTQYIEADLKILIKNNSLIVNFKE